MEREAYCYELVEENDLDNPHFTDHPDYGDLMTIEEFKENVECGGFIDYDGHGNLATEDKMSDVLVWPSTSKEMDYKFLDWATHVVWFNR